MTTTWPDLLAYNEAVQNPKRCFADPDLAGGQVATNALGWPLPFTGNFASVYRVSTPGPVPQWAVKCFTREVPDLQQRYQAVSDHLQARQGGPPFMVPFVYLPRGILVQGTWWPVLKMHWVEGFALNEFVRTHADKPQVLTNLAALWLKLAEELRGAGMAHGDLQHGNVILVKSERGVRLKLVDYDGLFVPALAATPPEEAGHPNYQHPGRRQAPYDFEIDRFSHLAICTALRCLACEGGESLWRQYDNGDNLLFRQEDFAAPGQSVLFRQLWSRRDFAERSLVGHLVLASLGPIEQLPLLADLVTNGQTRPLTAAQEQTLNGLFSARPGTPQPALPRALPSKPRATPLPDWLEQQPTASPLPLPAPLTRPPTQLSRPARNSDDWKVMKAVIAGMVLGLAALAGTWILYRSGENPPSQDAHLAQADTARSKDPVIVPPTPPKEEKKPAPPVLPGKDPGPAPDAGEPKPAPAPSPPPAAPLPRWARWVLRGHTEGVASIAFSRDGQRLASGSDDRTVRVWDVGTGKDIFTLPGHTEGVTSVAFSPDGRHLASGSHDGMVKFWDVGAGQLVRDFPGPRGKITRLAFNVNGRLVLCGREDKTVTAWDLETGREFSSPFPRLADLVSIAAFSPDGRHVASGGDETVRVRNVGADGDTRILKGHSRPVTCVAYCPNGRHIVSGSDDETVRVWDAAAGQEVLVLRGHTGGVASVAFSADGTQLLSGSRDKTLILWDLDGALKGIPPDSRPAPSDPMAAKTPRPPKIPPPFEGHASDVTSIAFSPDGRYAASGSKKQSYYGQVKIWEVGTGQEVTSFTKHEGDVTCVAFSPDGRHVASGSKIWASRGEVRVWEATTGKQVLPISEYEAAVSCVAFSPDSRHIASGSGRNVNVWETATEKEVLTYWEESGPIHSVAFSPDSRLVASGGDSGVVQVWDVGTRRKILTLYGSPVSIRCRCLVFSSDGRYIAGGGKRVVYVWDMAKAQKTRASLDKKAIKSAIIAGVGIDPARTLSGHRSDVVCVAFSPDGRFIVSGSDDRAVKVWDAETGQEILAFKEHPDSTGCMAFSPDGRYMAGSSGKTVGICDVGLGRPAVTLPGHTGEITSVGFSPDSQRLASGCGDKSVKVWNVGQGKELVTFKEHTDAVRSVAFSPDNRSIASGSEDRTVKIWNAGTGREFRTLRRHTDKVTSVAYSPDGQRLASGSDDRTVKIWNTGTGEEVRTLTGHTDKVRGVAFSPDGRSIASGSDDRTVKVWALDVENAVLTFPGHTDKVTSVAFSPDGQSIASGSDDRTVKVWDVVTRKPVLTLEGHTRPVISVAFSPDGRHVLSGSNDRTVRVWDAGAGKEILTIMGHTSWVNSVAFSPDGKRLASGSGDRTVKVWDGSFGPQGQPFKLPLNTR